jgi:hypothetical protein
MFLFKLYLLLSLLICGTIFSITYKNFIRGSIKAFQIWKGNSINLFLGNYKIVLDIVGIPDKEFLQQKTQQLRN